MLALSCLVDNLAAIIRLHVLVRVSIKISIKRTLRIQMLTAIPSMAIFWLEGVHSALWWPLFILNNREKHHIMHTMMILGVIMKCNTAKLFLQMSASWCPETFPEQWVYFFMKLFKVANNPTNCWNSIHGYNLARKSNALQWLATFLLNHRERHQNIRTMMVLWERERE